MRRNDLQIRRQGVHDNAHTGLLSFSLKTLRKLKWLLWGRQGRGFGDN